MPIGIINQSDYLKEVGTPVNTESKPAIPARSLVIDDVPKGRGNRPEVPQEIRNVIAQESFLGVSSANLAREFHVSEQSVNAYKNGSTSLATYNKPDKELKRASNIFRDRIVRKASRLSLAALDSIATSDFESASLRDKATVAKEMASIVRDMIPENDDNESRAPVQFIIHAPQLRKETDYIDGIVSQD